MWASILLRSSRGCCRLSPSSSSKLCATCLSCQQHQRQHTNRFTANHQKQSQRCFYDGSRFLDKIGTANLDWENMRFEYLQTNCHKFHTWKNGDWDDGVWQNVDTGLRLSRGAKKCRPPSSAAQLWSIAKTGSRKVLFLDLENYIDRWMFLRLW